VGDTYKYGTLNIEKDEEMYGRQRRELADKVGIQTDRDKLAEHADPRAWCLANPDRCKAARPELWRIMFPDQYREDVAREIAKIEAQNPYIPPIIEDDIPVRRGPYDYRTRLPARYDTTRDDTTPATGKSPYDYRTKVPAKKDDGAASDDTMAEDAAAPAANGPYNYRTRIPQ
jgi:hypothetical protein